MDQAPRPVRPPPETAEVAWRALALRTVLEMLPIQQWLKRADKSENEQIKAAFHDYFERMRLSGTHEHMSLNELELTGTSWSERDMINVSWRSEGLAVLYWAVSAAPAISPWDQTVDIGWIMDPARHHAGRFLDAARLRSPAEIAAARSLSELWHWRANQAHAEKLYGPVPPGAAHSFDAINRMVATGAHGDGLIPEPIAEDFPAFGKAYRDLSEDELSLAASIARERHFALNWLCGYSEDWDMTRTDT